MIAFIQAHWVAIVAAAGWSWNAILFTFNRIANSLPAPTKDATPNEVWWFTFVNNMAGNKERAKIPKIEDSPNFIAAAEAYHQQKLAEKTGGN